MTLTINALISAMKKVSSCWCPGRGQGRTIANIRNVTAVKFKKSVAWLSSLPLSIVTLNTFFSHALAANLYIANEIQKF